ncbi:MAG: FKBP-type peptidyl-prolyl cis-trans isomerase [Bacteroidota bacterium]
MKRILWFAAVLALGWMMACGGAEESREEAASTAPGKSQAEIDEEIIQQFLDDEAIQAQSTESGLYYTILEPGGAEKPTPSALVTVNYQGTTLEGKSFDGTEEGKSIRFPLAQLIPGWQQGIPLIGRGGKIKLYVPSGMAYGARQLGPDIAPNSVLVFDIELVDFE